MPLKEALVDFEKPKKHRLVSFKNLRNTFFENHTKLEYFSKKILLKVTNHVIFCCKGEKVSCTQSILLAFGPSFS